jgi:hypothetical protein
MGKKKKTVEKPELILTYRESTSGGEAINPEDSWSDHEDEYIEFDALKVFLGREKTKEWRIEVLYPKFEVKVGDIIHLVVVRYQTGGTFGTSHGNWCIEAVVKTAEEGHAIEKLIWEDWNHYKECSRKHGPRKDYKPIYKGEQGEYKVWQGYFEGLEGVEVESFVVE